MKYQRLQTVHDFAADNSFRYYQRLAGITFLNYIEANDLIIIDEYCQHAPG
jgi:hypothetical protein